MLFEQKYLTLNEIEIEHIEALNTLLATIVPNFNWLKSQELVSPQLRSYYYLFFSHTGNTPVGFFSLQVKIPVAPQTFMEKFKKKVSSKKELVTIDCFLKGVTGNYFFCQPQYEKEIEKKIDTIINNHINEFDKKSYDVYLNLVSNKTVINRSQTKAFTIPKAMLKIHATKKEVKNNHYKTFGSSWNMDECSIHIEEQIPETFLKLRMIKNSLAKAGFCQVTSNVDLNETHFYNIYLNTLDFLYANSDLSKIYFLNFNNSVSPLFENLKPDLLEQLGITAEHVYLYSTK